MNPGAALDWVMSRSPTKVCLACGRSAPMIMSSCWTCRCGFHYRYWNGYADRAQYAWRKETPWTDVPPGTLLVVDSV